MVKLVLNINKQSLTMKADFQVIHHEPPFLVIADLNQGNMSVTNDIYNVVKELSKKYDMTQHHLIYQDSESIFDAIDLDANGNFADFKPLRCTDMNTAIEAYKTRYLNQA